MSCGCATLEKTPYTAFSHFYTSVRLCFWVPFWSKFHFFCNFLVLNRHFYHNQRQNYGLLCLVLAFSSLAAAFCNTFHEVFLVPLSTSVQNHEKHKKKRKIRVFSRKCYLFCRKALRRVSLHLQQNITDLHQRFPVEKGAFSKFSPTMSHLSDASGHRGCTFTTLFLHIQTR